MRKNYSRPVILEALAKRLISSGRMPSPTRFMNTVLGSMKHEDPVMLSRRDSGRGYLFLSSSTREGSTKPEHDEPKFQELISHLRKLHVPHEVATGHWLDGAEEAVVASIPSHQIDRAGAALGKKYSQKSVLWFIPKPDGLDRLHIVHGDNIGDELLRRGIEYRTVVNGNKAYVADEGGAQAGKIKDLDHTSIPGTSWLLGADTREEARKVFDRYLHNA